MESIQILLGASALENAPMVRLKKIYLETQKEFMFAKMQATKTVVLALIPVRIDFHIAILAPMRRGFNFAR